MNTILRFGLLALFCLTSFSSHAWGTNGHRIIAEIAEAHLNKKAKKNIKKIIGNQKLAYWSNWADFIKSDPNPALQITGSWHFINAPANQTREQYQQVLQSSGDDNLYKAYLRVKTEAKSKNGTLQERQQHLYFILHLVGDAHQPMHVGREEDRGGNSIDVTFFGRNTNIHRVWDSDLVDHEKYSYTEYARVLNIDRDAYAKYARHSSWEDWLYESHQVANKVYNDLGQYNHQLSYSYIFNYKYIMEDCLLKAGLRLAKELNDIYGV